MRGERGSRTTAVGRNPTTNQPPNQKTISLEHLGPADAEGCSQRQPITSFLLLGDYYTRWHHTTSYSASKMRHHKKLFRMNRLPSELRPSYRLRGARVNAYLVHRDTGVKAICSPRRTWWRRLGRWAWRLGQQPRRWRYLLVAPQRGFPPPCCPATRWCPPVGVGSSDDA